MGTEMEMDVDSVMQATLFIQWTENGAIYF